MNSLRCKLLLLLMLFSVYGSQKSRKVRSHYLRRSPQKRSPWLMLHSMLDENNNQLTNSLATTNEVDDMVNYNYYMMDQEAVKRAWSKNEKTRAQEKKHNLHYFNLARQNVELVLKTAKCKEPTRRCLDVHRMNFDGKKKKKYWPNCAIVHKCGHDSGCCNNPEHTCAPIKMETIDLHFLRFDKEKETGSAGVEMLTFQNHTLCGCRPLQENSIFLETPRECFCPKKFYPSESVLECQCDCDQKKNRSCRRVKRGRRSYNYKGGCQGQPCSLPKCDFGSFLEEFSRCPRKSERKRK